jgi:hypothetical protein
VRQLTVRRCYLGSIFTQYYVACAVVALERGLAALGGYFFSVMASLFWCQARKELCLQCPSFWGPVEGGLECSSEAMGQGDNVCRSLVRLPSHGSVCLRARREFNEGIATETALKLMPTGTTHCTLLAWVTPEFPAVKIGRASKLLSTCGFVARALLI